MKSEIMDRIDAGHIKEKLSHKYNQIKEHISYKDDNK